jgi:hypothetical protein
MNNETNDVRVAVRCKKCGMYAWRGKEWSTEYCPRTACMGKLERVPEPEPEPELAMKVFDAFEITAKALAPLEPSQQKRVLGAVCALLGIGWDFSS